MQEHLRSMHIEQAQALLLCFMVLEISQRLIWRSSNPDCKGLRRHCFQQSTWNTRWHHQHKIAINSRWLKLIPLGHLYQAFGDFNMHREADLKTNCCCVMTAVATVTDQIPDIRQTRQLGQTLRIFHMSPYLFLVLTH